MVNELGIDRSGNNNTWTVNNMTLAADQMLDSPTNNFATLNPVSGEGSNALSEGNLKVANVSGGASGWTETAPSTFILPTTGKWYWEWQLVDCAGEVSQGPVITTATNSIGAGTSGILDLRTNNGSAGTIGLDGTDNVQTGLAIAAEDDIFAIAVDCVNETFQGYLNGSAFGTSVDYSGVASNKKDNLVFRPMVTSSGHNVTFIANFGQDSSFAGTKTAQGNKDDNGIGDFYYTPPTDFLALCTSNLPEPAVIPSEHFNTVTYTGDATTSRTITGAGFAPDLLWGKIRSTTNNNFIFDSIRGTNRLVTNGTSAEADYATWFSTLTSDGFTTGTTNANSMNQLDATFVAWFWKANGSGSANTDGNMAETVTVSANTDAGFSIVTFTGDGANATVGHGLSKAPEMVIVKCRSHSGDWAVYRTDQGAGNNLRLHSYAPVYSASTMWNSTASTATVFSIGTNSDVNTDDRTYVAYCFHSVDGFSKVGTYTGNADADGPFVYTGFRPAYVMAKNASADTGSGNGDWNIFDTTRSTYNPMDDRLRANDNTAEGGSSEFIDFLSNGFKPRYTGEFNQANEVVYLAFAETPFKYSNAR